MIPKSLHSLLGLCQRAGKAASGDVAVAEALKRRSAELLIVAEDASERTRERWFGLAARTGLPCYSVGTRDELGAALGKEHRSAVAIQSKEFAAGMVSILEREGLARVEAVGRG